MIESLHSPHVARVKALLGSRGKKSRKESGIFVAEGLQFLREAAKIGARPKIDTLYLTRAARQRLIHERIDIDHLNTEDVSDDVMNAMGETVTPQGIIALCELPELSSRDMAIDAHAKFIYLYEIQDPGNAGTILRSADAAGFSGVITSPNSVDFFSPKVVRSSAGSLWHIPVFEGIELADLLSTWPSDSRFGLEVQAGKSLLEVKAPDPSLWIFGNEAHGLPKLDAHLGITSVSIPMKGNAESLNLAAAASIVMFYVTQLRQLGQ